MTFKVKFNSPAVLSIALLCAIFFLANWVSGHVLNRWLALSPHWSLAFIPNALTYTLAHANFEHLMGNLAIFLLIGPGLEQRYGLRNYLLMTLACVVVTALIHVLLFDVYLLGLSGVVFMNIVLASFTNVRRGEIPLTFIIVLILFVGREVVDAFREDQVSQFAHILGGLVGGLFGILGIGLRPVQEEE